MNVSQNPVYKVLHLGCTLRLYPCPKEKKKLRYCYNYKHQGF